MCLFLALCLGGVQCNANTWFFNADAQVPVAGQTCTNTIPRLPIAARNPVVGMLGAGNNLLSVCFQFSVFWACVTLPNAAPIIWSAPILTTFDHKSTQAVFDSANGRIINCDDNPDTNTQTEAFNGATWQANIYPKPPHKNGPGLMSGCAIANGYLYFFGWNYIQRIRLVNIQANTWEPLGDGIGLTTLPRFFRNPVNPSQIVITPQYNIGTSVIFTLFDTFSLAKTTLTISSTTSIDGADFSEMCSNVLNIVAVGSGFLVYTPATPVAATTPILTGTGAWNAIVNVPSVSRCYGSCIRVPVATVANYVTGCAGC